ncbi:hypothetical protein [Dokdonia sp. PRO95]|uniref:IS1096 element passenger TnpR family protein n=1 Tax=Dokdonia sp. PRO95 TaxID=1239415 RepID=UPI00054D4B45|nr:hypothetical protein [Dokdonia sp. PRO95]
MIYRFRAILDTEEDVFRDLEIEATDTLEDLHNAINQSFGFDGAEVAAFYLSDDTWMQGEEFAQFEMGEGESQLRIMNETSLDGLLGEHQTRLIYVYDFLNMWRFLVELAEITEPEDGMTYPNLMYVQGQVPDQAPEFEMEDQDLGAEDDDDDEFNDDYNIDDFDDLSFDENWN